MTTARPGSVSNLRISVLVDHATPLIGVGAMAVLSGFRNLDLTLRAPVMPATNPDVVITDLETFRAACGGEPAWRERAVILPVQPSSRDLWTAIDLGARGFLTADCTASELVQAVHVVANGRRYFSPAAASCLAERSIFDCLTRRETDVLQQVALGERNKVIARNLGVGEDTVKTHVRSILSKLQVATRTQAVVLAARQGLISLPLQRQADVLRGP